MLENKESFHSRVAPFFAPKDLLDIKLAYTLAKFGHRAQFRKELQDGQPMRYFEHVRRVALILMDEAKIMDKQMIISALLHDALEDTEDITPELLEHCYDTDIVSIIKTLSKTPKEGYIERLHMCRDWRPLIIKSCDRLDNLRSLMVEGPKPDFQKRQIEETIEKYIPIFSNTISLVPEHYKKSAMRIRDEILKVTERNITILELKKTSSFYI